MLLSPVLGCSLGMAPASGKFHAGSVTDFAMDSNGIFKSCPGFSIKETISLKAAWPSLFCFVPTWLKSLTPLS